MRSIAAVISVFVILGCASEKKHSLPKDLEEYTDLVANCIKIERMCQNDPLVLASELRDLKIPEDPKKIVEELVARYGRDPNLWHRVYQEIINRSRS